MARTAKRYQESKVLYTEAVDLPRSALTRYNVGIYSRLSVDNHDKKAESIENQIETIRQFIHRSNLETGRGMELVIYDTYIDRGKTGTDFEREGFHHLMDDVRNGTVNCIIVKDFSRFGRDYIETGNYIEKILPFLEVRFISVADGFDSMGEAAANGKLAMNIKNLVNDMYAKDISKRVAISKEMRAKQGSFLGSIPPYGYQIKNVNGVRTLAADEKAAEIVKWIFANYVSGVSIKDICEKLYEEKIHRVTDYHKYGHIHYEDGDLLHQWDKEAVKGIIRNPSYTGKLIQGKSSSRLYEGKKEVSRTKPDEWITVSGTHEGIIDNNVYQQAMERLEREGVWNKQQINAKSKAAMKEKEAIYQNILFCGQCGKKLKASFQESRTTGKRTYTYYCKAAYYLDYRKCNKKSIREDNLNGLLKDAVCSEFGRIKLCAKDITRLNSEYAMEKNLKHEQEKKEILRESVVAKKKSLDMFTAYKEGDISREDFEQFRKKKEESEAFFSSRLMEIEKKEKKLKQRMEEENKFLRSLFKVESSNEINRMLVESLVEKILLYPDKKVEIFFRFRGGDFLDR